MSIVDFLRRSYHMRNNVFTRSFQGLNLTPGERALVKLVEGWIFTALATGIAIAYQLLATGSHNYNQIALVAGGAAGLTVLNSWKKFLAAQTDLPLATASLATQATDVAIAEVQKVAPQAQQAAAQVQVPQFQFTNTPQPTNTTFVQPLSVTAQQPFPYQSGSTYPSIPAQPAQ
jgi:hypothetical protein